MRRSCLLIQVLSFVVVVVLIGVVLVWVSMPSHEEISTIFVRVVSLRMDREFFLVEWGISAKPGTEAYARDLRRMQRSPSDFCDREIEFSSSREALIILREKAPGEKAWRWAARTMSARQTGRYLSWIENIASKGRFAGGHWGSRYWIKAFVSDDVLSTIWAERASH